MPSLISKISDFSDPANLIPLAIAVTVLLIIARRFSQVRERSELSIALGERRLDVAINNMSQGLCFFDGAQRLILCNDRYLEMYGLPRDRVGRGTTLAEIVDLRFEAGTFPAMSRDEYLAWRNSIVVSMQPQDSVVELRDGRTFRIHHRPMADSGWVATHEDITAQKRLEKSLYEKAVQLEASISNIPQGLSMFDEDDRLVLCNQQYARMYRFPARLLEPGTSLQDIFAYMKQENILKGRQEDASEQPHRYGVSKLPAERRLIWIDEHSDGKLIRVVREPMEGRGWLTTHEDITEQRKLEQERDRSHAFLRQIIDEIPTQITVKDARDRRYVLANRAAEAPLGASQDEIIGKSAYDLYSRENADVVTAYDDEALQSADTLLLREHAFETLKFGTRFLTTKRISIRDKLGSPNYLINVVDDVTERKLANDRIAHLAHYDALTDLPNRALFREKLEQALNQLAPGQKLAVLYLDLDQFKSVNDTLGHPIGDELLTVVAGRLRSCLKEAAFVARLGGDEFAVIHGALETSEDTADLARFINDTIRVPFQLDGHRIVIDTSIGIAIAPQDGAEPDQLLRSADLALYGAKGNGRGTYRFFEPDMDARAKARRELEFDLRSAIERGELELYYQPLVNIRADRISGCEALMRWRHPRRGLISPTEFIPVAEDSGFISQLGEWAIREACTEAASWPDDIKVAVNVSPVQFRNGTLALTVASALAACGLSAHRLELEITEAVLIRDDETAIAILLQLQQLGVRIALDDFGTGYSSLSYLKRFPFNKIKIDRCFVKDIAESSDSRSIIDAVVNIAAARNMTTTAEGVETLDQLEALRTSGCTEMQGFLFCSPKPAADIRRLLSTHDSTRVNAA
jgi:diguanylate cyclase (GGDEF)-like protein/PAS domain S-box-containing protein